MRYGNSTNSADTHFEPNSIHKHLKDTTIIMFSIFTRQSQNLKKYLFTLKTKHSLTFPSGFLHNIQTVYVKSLFIYFYKCR